MGDSRKSGPGDWLGSIETIPLYKKIGAIIEPNQFADEFNLAVVGHAGWDKNLENQTSYALSVSFEALDVEMSLYEVMAEAQVEVEQELEIEL